MSSPARSDAGRGTARPLRSPLRPAPGPPAPVERADRAAGHAAATGRGGAGLGRPDRGGPGTAGRADRAERHRVAAVLAPVVLLTALVAAWQLLVATRHVRPQIVPSPWRVITQGFDDRQALWSNTLPTLEETGLGFTVSLACAWCFAVAMHFSRLVRQALYPLLVASQTLPLVAVAPLVDLWLGFGLASKLVVVAIVTFFPVTVALTEGFGAAETEGVKLLRSMGAGRAGVFRRLELPGALPHFFAGLRIAITYAVVGAIFSEYVGATAGLGIFISEQANQARTDLVYAAVALTAALSIALFGLTFLLERLLIPWYWLSRCGGRAPGRPARPLVGGRSVAGD